MIEAATTSTSVEHSSTSNKHNLWELFDSIVKESQTSQEAVDATLQGRHYVEETILPRRDDPMRWWRDQEKHYTLLSILALKYLSISGTSVSSEHLFSKARELVSAKRSWIKPRILFIIIIFIILMDNTIH